MDGDTLWRAEGLEGSTLKASVNHYELTAVLQAVLAHLLLRQSYGVDITVYTVQTE